MHDSGKLVMYDLYHSTTAKRRSTKAKKSNFIIIHNGQRIKHNVAPEIMDLPLIKP